MAPMLKPPAILALTFVVLACGEAPPESNAADLVCAERNAVDGERAMGLYLAAFSEANPSEVPCLLQRSLAPEAVWIDAGGVVEGRPDVRVVLQASAAALSVDGENWELARPAIFRHQEALVEWVTLDEAGAVVDSGEDWIEFADDGRIAMIHRFTSDNSEIPLPAALSAWELAWNDHDEAAQLEHLRLSTTESVRFTDLLVDVQHRGELLSEIRRQQALLDGMLDLGRRVQVHAGTDENPITIRHDARISLPGGPVIEITNFIRLRGGRIERLSGYPRASL